MEYIPRPAFFAGSFHEPDSLGLTSREFQAFAQRRGLPFFSVHAGPSTRKWTEGDLTVLELQRGKTAIDLDDNLHFDPLLWRHTWRAEFALSQFKPDIIHVTGPGDCGIMGAYLARAMGVPLVASWHRDLHEFAARRLQQLLSFVPSPYLDFAVDHTQRHTLESVALFYRFARVLLAPSPDRMEMLRRRTGKPVFLMRPGVDTELFHPARRFRQDGAFTIGYVGQLRPERNVRFLAEIERSLPDGNHRFLIAGEGPERDWLERNMRRAEFAGVLHGEQLARACANMDLFVCPSGSHTPVLEALASGVPVVVFAPGFPVRGGADGFVARDSEDFLWGVKEILSNPSMHQSMREEARRGALGASWDRVFEQVYRVYSSTQTHTPDLRAAS